MAAALACAGLWPASARAGFEVIGTANERAARTVVLLHGLNRSSASMRDLAEALAAAGWRAVNVDYPSAQFPIAVLVEMLDADIARCCARARADGLDFVTHSLGGVLLRVWAEANPDARIRRAVMLSPPSAGTELVDVLRDSPLFQLITGPAGQELGTDAGSVPSRLEPVRFELGVIAGRSSLNPIHSWLIPGEDDGTVAVERTRAAGMRDFLVLEHSHTFIMYGRDVIRQAIAFLRSGRFERGATNARLRW